MAKKDNVIAANRQPLGACEVPPPRHDCHARDHASPPGYLAAGLTSGLKSIALGSRMLLLEKVRKNHISNHPKSHQTGEMIGISIFSIVMQSKSSDLLVAEDE